MRNAAALSLAAALIALAGCQNQNENGKIVRDRVANSLRYNGLAVSLKLPKRYYAMGEQIKVDVSVRNNSDKAMEIDSRGDATAFVRVYEFDGMDWFEFKRFPESLSMAANHWTLKPGETVKSSVVLPIGRDWPTDQLLRITAELNGRPDPSPGVDIIVETPYSKAK